MHIREFIQAKTRNRYEEITEMPHEEGGFGRLYKAVDTQNHRAEVCIKVIKPNLGKDLQQKLWEKEVMALKHYKHRSGIVHLVGEQYKSTPEDPFWFIVMEYVHGKRLGTSKYRIEVDVEENQAIRLIFQLCSVIYSIHQRGQYHQDIFPDNIKIQDERLVLLDLGGMREAERRSGTIIFGGEMYSPPEVSPTRLRMKRFRTLRHEKMGPFRTADIFSMGAIFYELMMGVPFFESVDQSEQLKEYIYDYYTDSAVAQSPKKEYQQALDRAQQNQQKFYTYLHRCKMPDTLCKGVISTLNLLHPQERPSIDTLLGLLVPYMLQQATECCERGQWNEAQLWLRCLRDHFDEIQAEIAFEPSDPDDEAFFEDEDFFAEEETSFSEELMNHLLTHLLPFFQSQLLTGICLFNQGEFELAQQQFLRTKELLERYEYGCPEPQWNGMLLKVVNNLAACCYKRNQQEEALHLYNSLSTAQGKFGQIISHNLQVCTP